MVHLVWEPSFETGIDAIDTQHRRIVDYINQLHDAISHKEPHVIAQTLDHLCDYIATHFTFEEGLMERVGYSHAAAHKVVHDNFAKSIRSYTRRFDNGEDIAKQLRAGLCVWLIEHIKQEDGAYVEVAKNYLSGIKRG